MPAPPIIRSTARVVRELGVHLRRLSQGATRPRIIVLPSAQSGASRLRGWLIGKALIRLGWRVTIMPSQLTLAQRLRVIRMERPDVILMQQARHPLNRPEYCNGVPYVFDIDDADYVDPKLTEAVTRCVQEAAYVSAGSQVIADWCRQHNPSVQVVWTSTPIAAHHDSMPHAKRRPIISWAQSSPMGYQHEALFVRDVALGLASRRTFELMFFGIKDRIAFEQYIQPVREAGVTVHAYEYLNYDTYLQKNAEAAVGLNPIDLDKPFHRGKSFGKVLAYLYGRTPTVASPLLEMPHFFTDGINGRLVENDCDAWISAIEQLLDHPVERQRLADAAYEHFRNYLSTEVVSRQYDAMLRRVIDQAEGKPS